MQTELKNLVIEGNIGAGKTSLAKMICKRYRGKLLAEQFLPNPYLSKFYSDPEYYALPLELSLLAERYNQVRNHIESSCTKDLVVWDYHIGKSLVFSGITLKKQEKELFIHLFSIMSKTFPQPDLFIYLHKEVDHLLENIKKRGRPYEKSVDAGYLKKLEEAYFNYLSSLKGVKILVIDTNNIDFAGKKSDFDAISDSIFNKSHSEGINNVLL